MFNILKKRNKNETLIQNGVWGVTWGIEKFHSDDSLQAGVPDEVYRSKNNLLLNEGINEIWRLVCGNGGTPFNATNSHLGVCDSTTTPSASDTGMGGTNKMYQLVDSGYPQSGSNQKVIFRATFGPNDANFQWRQWTVANGASDTAVNMNLKAEPMGEKYDGSTWIITVEISLT